MPRDALPDELRPAAEALVAELRDNPHLAGFSTAELRRLVASSGYRRTLEREHLARQCGFRHAGQEEGACQEEGAGQDDGSRDEDPSAQED